VKNYTKFFKFFSHLSDRGQNNFRKRIKNKNRLEKRKLRNNLVGKILKYITPLNIGTCITLYLLYLCNVLYYIPHIVFKLDIVPSIC